MGPLDIAVVVAYLVAIVGLGCWAGLRAQAESQEAKGYFLAGGQLKWPVIGLALFATNISTVHLVGLAEAGYTSGLLMGNFELLAGFTLVVLAVFFAPFYVRSRVATLPDFLERRYSRLSRDIVAVLSVFSAIFIHIGFSLYTGAVVLNGIFGVELSKTACVLVIAGLTGLYTILGGLTAVVVTESIQTLILLAGAIVIALAAWFKVGGWPGITAAVPHEQLTLLRGSEHAGELPWYSLIFGYPVIGIWYWCTDQTIVQRVLGAKDENHARTGALFAGFIKILPLFIFVLPGTMCLALVKQGALSAADLHGSADTYAFLIRELLPTGLRGLMAAALLAAVMSTVSGALNSIGTLVSYDLVQRARPGTDDRTLVLVGRWASFLAMVLAVVWSLTLNPDGIFQAINAMITYIAPPMTCVFLYGVLWERASAIGSAATLLVGTAAGLTLFALNQLAPAWWTSFATAYHFDFLLQGIALFLLSSAVMVLVSTWRPHRHTPESRNLVWRSIWEPLRAPGWPGLANFKVIAAALVAVLLAIYTTFS
ncbi:MAG: sodium/solute symporter [Pirellulales bacterium]